MKSPAIIVAALVLATSPVAAGEATPLGVARTVSKFAIYATQCSKVRRVNVEVAKQYVITAVTVGFEMAGNEEFQRINYNELARRKAEVAATGVAEWCGYQSNDPLVAKTGVFY